MNKQINTQMDWIDMDRNAYGYIDICRLQMYRQKDRWMTS